MELLFTNIYVTYYFDSENSCVEEHWKKETEQMTSEGIKDAMNALCMIFENHHASAFLSNAKDFYFRISPPMQKWIDDTVAPVAIKNGMKKIARVLSDDFISQLSLEQFVEEQRTASVRNKFFKTLDEARLWIATS